MKKNKKKETLKDKINSQINHVKRRAKERFSLILNDNHINDMVTKIINGDCTFVKEQPHSKTVWDIDFMGKQMRIVFNEITCHPITIMYRFGHIY